MNRKTLAALSFCAIASCSPAQVERANTYQQQIASACAVAMTLAPLAPQIAPWIVGGCQSEMSIAKLALDPLRRSHEFYLKVKARAGR